MLDAKIFQLVKEPFLFFLVTRGFSPYHGTVWMFMKMPLKVGCSYHSKYDLLHWLTFWTQPSHLSSPFVGEKRYESILRSSFEKHQHVLGMLFSKECVEAKLPRLCVWNAIVGNIISQYCPEVK